MLEALLLAQEQALKKGESDKETANAAKSMQIDQAVHAPEHEDRLAEMQMKSEERQGQREKQLKKLEAEIRALLQGQDDELQARAQQAELSRQKQRHDQKRAQEQEAARAKLTLREKEIELARLRQQARNLVNETDLQSRFIEKLPELASGMPEIHEYKVLQTGDSDSAFSALSAFVAQLLSVAESLGVSFKAAKTGKDAEER